MKKTLTTLLALAGLSLGANAEPSQQSETHGDWTVRCVERVDLPPCDMIQMASHKESGEQVMQLSIAHAGKVDVFGVQFLVPLGVRIDEGVAIRVDEQVPMTDYDFTRCAAEGCYIEKTVGHKEMDVFRRGKAGILVMLEGDGEPLVVPLSFDGFTDALKVVEKRNRNWAGLS